MPQHDHCNPVARGRYRRRTRIRERLPWWLIRLGVAAPGKKDCGDHDWYLASKRSDGTWVYLCYHCEPGRLEIPR